MTSLDEIPKPELAVRIARILGVPEEDVWVQESRPDCVSGFYVTPHLRSNSKYADFKFTAEQYYK